MKKLIVIFSLFLSVSAFAQKADSVKTEVKANTGAAYGSMPPLVMVDGTRFYGDINKISPGDIEKMEILKSASATSAYGADALNGVILITTKKGKATKLIKTGTVATATAPLYIIDGNTASAKTLQNLSPGDIDNISVLKDASANSIYGPAGKNGVVIVVTKAYKKQQEAKKAEAERQGKKN